MHSNAAVLCIFMIFTLLHMKQKYLFGRPGMWDHEPYIIYITAKSDTLYLIGWLIGRKHDKRPAEPKTMETNHQHLFNWMIPFKPSWQPFALHLKSQMFWHQSFAWVSWRGTWRWTWWKERKRKSRFAAFWPITEWQSPKCTALLFIFSCIL